MRKGGWDSGAHEYLWESRRGTIKVQLSPCRVREEVTRAEPSKGERERTRLNWRIYPPARFAEYLGRVFPSATFLLKAATRALFLCVANAQYVYSKRYTKNKSLRSFLFFLLYPYNFFFIPLRFIIIDYSFPEFKLWNYIKNYVIEKALFACLMIDTRRASNAFCQIYYI